MTMFRSFNWLSRRRGAQTPDLVPRWKAFVLSPAADGEPVIRPANVPPVKKLKGEKDSEWARLMKRRA